ncbi:MAG TPA: hypothetical protein VFX70_11910 [Mycobacteriales bacterium]|nr:hypothetical protein [Mycobacteriales bacterium]
MCADGTPRLVYRDIDAALPLYLPGFHAGVDASIPGVAAGQALLRSEYETRIQGLLYALSEKNDSLMMMFRSVYLVFQSDPCRHGDYLAKQVERLNADQLRLANVRLMVRGLIDLAASNPDQPDMWANAFLQVVARLGGGSPEVEAAAAAAAIGASRSAAREWIAGDQPGPPDSADARPAGDVR